MTEEEKKAIEHTERFCYGKQLWEEDLECIKALLNLIEKQNNRLEQLEKENKELSITCKEQSELIEDTYINYNDLEFTRLKRRNKELEKELEPIHKLGIPVEVLVSEFDRLENLEDDRVQLKVELEQLEKENKEYKDYIEKLDKLNAKDFIFKHELEDYIPKSVIRDKIEELKKRKRL